MQMDTEKDPRFVSRLTREAVAVVLAGGRGSRLHELTKWRAKPGVSFGGKFRIIDFPLSNCINSGIRRIAVLTQYKAHSLIRHLVYGWTSFQPELGEFVEILPASQRTSLDWYAGTADAIYQNLDIIRTYQPRFILVLAGDHVYKMDYGPLLAYHLEKAADVTIACSQVSIEDAPAYGIMSLNAEQRVNHFEEKPAHPRPMPGNQNRSLASMGIYVFNTGFLFEQIIRDADTPLSSHDFGRDIIPAVVPKYRVFGYPFRNPMTGKEAYWRDVGTVDTYWEANIELVGITPELNLYDQDWPIRTYQEQLPPAKFVFDDDLRRGTAINSMVCGGCVVSGALVRRSLLFSNVKVNSFAKVEDSVVLPEVNVGRHCRIRRAVIDRGAEIPEGMVIGEDLAEDAKRFRVTERGIVLVTPDMLNQRKHFHR
jgi:glucose-1-phosphate adenylyltransferase